MKRRFVPALLLCALLLTGCASFLNREYSDSKAHSATYFGGDDRSVLRVESYQDLVSGLLMLVSDRAAEATVWLYPSAYTTDATQAMARACSEVQRETPVGSYAVSYLTYTVDESAHNYTVFRLTVGYRRSAEQVAAMVHTTGVSALYDLLNAAADRSDSELVVWVNNFDRTREEIRAEVAALQLERYLAEHPPEESEEPDENQEPEENGETAENQEPEENGEPPEGEEPAPSLPEDVQRWQVNFYPAEGEPGIVEILLAY